MACFLAPAGALVVTTTIRKKIPKHYHPEWLNAMLWGGVIMLVVDHIFSRELVPYPPFLTAMDNPADFAVMLREIAIVGTTMVATIFLVWLAAVWSINLFAGYQKNSASER